MKWDGGDVMGRMYIVTSLCIGKSTGTDPLKFPMLVTALMMIRRAAAACRPSIANGTPGASLLNPEL